MKHNGFYDDIEEMLADPDFQTDFDVQEDELKDLRKAIKKGEMPEWIIEELTDMHATYTDGQSLRYRSSTNNEDLPGFNGAGLYDSKTQHPEETEEDGIAKSLKQVYASLWNFRAFTEREFHRIDHLAAAMGVLVHPNYSGELANGVAVSFDPFTSRECCYYVNTQIGEDLITNPDAHSVPEEVLLRENGHNVLATSNEVEPGQLLMSDVQMSQLRQHLTVVHEEFKELYNPAPGEPFAMEIEFKITSVDILAIKQARPWVFSPNSNTRATGLPTISGTAQVGETLTASISGIDDADGLDNAIFSYQWLANGVDIASATSDTYTLVEADVGKAVKVKVSFRDDKNNPETLTSAATAAVEPRPNSPATGAPTISGTVRVGETLTVETSAIADADGMSGAVFIYQWLADDADIAGATSNTYTLVETDVGKAIKVRVIFTDNADNEETLTSEATAAVEPRPNSPATGAPTISGTAQAGETLTADTDGIEDDDGLADAVFSYQWLASGADVAGATSDTYTPVADDVGKAIKVKVSFRDDRNHQESLTSAATAAVTAAADDSAVWSATLTVGESWGFVGFWKSVCGALDPDEFSLDGNDYPISMFAELSDRYFQFRLDQALPIAFTLRVRETTFESKDAEQLGGSSSGVYQWTGQLAGLTEGSTVEVSLTLAE